MKFLIILLFPIFIFGQTSVNPKVNEFTETFDLKNDYFFVDNTHPGAIFMVRPENMEYEECVKVDYYFSTNLYWQGKDGNFYEKSFYPCSETETKLTNSDFLDFARKNFEILKTEEVKKYQLKKDSIVGNTIYGSNKILNHQPVKNYTFKIRNEIIFKRFETYYLTTEGDNINYEHNQSLKLIELDRMLDN